MERFGCSSENDLSNVLKDKNTRNTGLSTTQSWTVFTTYLNAKSVEVDPETIKYQRTIELNFKKLLLSFNYFNNQLYFFNFSRSH